jgi:hypothetical protein
MPHVLDVGCPDCGGHAKFEFAEAARIHLSKDLAYFRNSKEFDYFKVQEPAGGFCHIALYFHRLGRRDLAVIDDLPEGYSPEDWQHSQYLMRSHDAGTGAVSCAACGLKGKHDLDWPNDALFQIEYRGSVLWAFNRESACELLAFIESEDRTRNNFTYSNFLMKVPTVFLARKAREAVVKRLTKVLSNGQT